MKIRWLSSHGFSPILGEVWKGKEMVIPVEAGKLFVTQGDAEEVKSTSNGRKKLKESAS